VALLLRFEQANPNAANALLKTLEEPPPHVVLILTADSAEALLPTIVSRCEVVRLAPVAADQIRQDLEQNLALGPEMAALCAQLSAGRPGYARFLARNPDFLDQRRRWLDDQSGLLSAGRAERFAYVGRLSEDRDALRQTLQVWISFWHDVLFRAAGAEAALTNPDRAQEIETLAASLQLERAFSTVRSLERTLALIESNVNRRLAAEVLMLDLPHLPAHGAPTDSEPLST
jgi:DNA polymerase-3 subunit delta'